MNTYESRSKAKTITAVIAIAAVIGIVILIEVLQSNAKSASSTASVGTTDSSTSTQAPSAADTSATSSDTTAPTSSTYKDGTYTADAEYYVPHGYEDIKVTFTVANGIVTDSNIVNSESDHDSQRYQKEFAAEYKTYVVGKNLADIKLSYVAGASDTTDGFNDALAKIRTQAQA